MKRTQWHTAIAQYAILLKPSERHSIALPSVGSKVLMKPADAATVLSIKSKDSCCHGYYKPVYKKKIIVITQKFGF